MFVDTSVFIALLTGEPDADALAELFDPAWYLRHVDEVMDRVAAL